MKKILLIVILLIATAALAEPPKLYDGKTGKYLGNLSGNRYDPESVNNEYSKYGSKYAPDSINNEYGRYGSKYSNDSPNNPYATNAPVIYGAD